MPRGPREIHGGVVYHVLNRGNERRQIFFKPSDYDAFITLLIEGKQHARVQLLAYCLMPNHWHVCLLPETDQDLGKYVGWVTNTHVKRYRQHYQTTGNGHVYQGRYKNFATQDDFHLLVVLRYVEANALRAGLVARAEHWQWCSASPIAAETRSLLDPWPIQRPSNWLEMVNEVQPAEEVTALRKSLKHDQPFGSEAWLTAFGKHPGLRPRRRGRPLTWVGEGVT